MCLFFFFWLLARAHGYHCYIIILFNGEIIFDRHNYLFVFFIFYSQVKTLRLNFLSHKNHSPITVPDLFIYFS